MECIEILKRSGEYEIADKSNSCPRCGAETKEADETSSLGKKQFCEKCDQTFAREMFIDCENKKVEIRLKNV